MEDEDGDEAKKKKKKVHGRDLEEYEVSNHQMNSIYLPRVDA